jgi:hypothetical protein
MSSQAAATMQHNADMVTNAFIWHLAVPCALWAIAIGFLVIAFEIVKRIVLKEIRKLRTKPAKRPF